VARIPAWVVDAGLAAAVAVAGTLTIPVAPEPGARPPDLLAYALGWTTGAVLLARRRWPLAVLAASLATLQLYYTLDYPGMSAAVPLAVALYTAGPPVICGGRCWWPPGSWSGRLSSCCS
jgi:hypothetical protein